MEAEKQREKGWEGERRRDDGGGKEREKERGFLEYTGVDKHGT